MEELHVQRTRSNEKGFTLVELLVVIVIIGILAAVAVFAVAGITDKGEESACEATSNTVRAASEAFRAQNDAYAANLTALEADFLRLDDDTTVDATDLIITVDGGTITYGGTSGSVTDTCA